MKKIVVILITLISLGSILIINFFGMEIGGFEEYVYVEKIEISRLYNTEEEYTPKEVRENGEIVFQFPFTTPEEVGETSWTSDNIDKNPNYVQIDWHIYPENANNRKVNISYDGSSIENSNGEKLIIVDETKGLVIFLARRGITLTVISTDGKGANSTIYISPRAKV